MSTFEKDFLDNYLKFGLGAMPKSDIDALVMHLLDTYGLDGAPLAIYSNQTVSERLKTPVAKIKKLRYESALKFGGQIEEQAKGRLLAALSKASLEPDGEKIGLIIEDALAKNWLQGQLKIHQHIFDYSFNTEIVKVNSADLFDVLAAVFDLEEITAFKQGYDEAKTEKTHKKRLDTFKSVVNKFAEGAAKAAGNGVVKVLRAQLGL